MWFISDEKFKKLDNISALIKENQFHWQVISHFLFKHNILKQHGKEKV